MNKWILNRRMSRWASQHFLRDLLFFPVMFRLLDNVDHGLWLTEMSWLVFSHLSILYYCHPRVRASLRPSVLDTLRSRSQKEALQVRHWRLDGAPLNSHHTARTVSILQRLPMHPHLPFFPLSGALVDRCCSVTCCWRNGSAHCMVRSGDCSSSP